MNKKRIILIILAIAILLTATYFICINIVNSGIDYEVVKVETVNYYKINEENKYGVIDLKGNIVIEPKYQEIKIPNPEVPIFVCYDGAYTIVLNEKNGELYSEYNQVEAINLQNIASEFMYEKSVLTYEKDGKYGIIDLEGEKLTNAIYDEIEGLPYKEGELLVAIDGLYGVINIKGNTIVKCEYQEIKTDGSYSETEGYRYSGYIVSIRTDEGYRYGYIDYKGNEIVEPQYNQLERVFEKKDDENIYFIAAENGQYGILKNDENILNNEYQSIRYDYIKDVFVVEKSKKYGVVNAEGQIIIPVEYDDIEINGIYIYAKKQQGVTVFDGNGTQVNIDPNIEIIETANSKYLIKTQIMENSTRYGIQGSQGNELIAPKYNYIEYLNNDYFIVSNESRQLGIVDSRDNQYIEIKYNSVKKIENSDLIEATVDNITDVYNSRLELIYSLQDARVENVNGYIKIYNQNEVKYFNSSGIEIKSSDIFKNNNLFANVKDGKWGFVNKSGEVVIENIYEQVSEFNENGFASVKKDGKWGAINVNGEEVAEIKYEFTNYEIPNFIDKYYRVVYGTGEIYYKK